MGSRERNAHLMGIKRGRERQKKQDCLSFVACLRTLTTRCYLSRALVRVLSEKNDGRSLRLTKRIRLHSNASSISSTT